jgi:hypothetical protein
MSIYVVFRVAEPEKIKAAMAEKFPNDNLEVSPGQFLVSSSLSAQGVSDSLGISDGPNGAGIVFAMSGYFGRASTNIWDWIKAKAEKSDG